MEMYQFQKAIPVWEAGKDQEMNYHLVFRCVVPAAEHALLALSASCMYQTFVNGSFVAEGPARAGHGFYRVDELDLGAYLTNEKNVISIYVAGYNVESFYLIKQPSFLCAEVLIDGDVVAATGHNGFSAKYNDTRVRKISRFSYQRTFNEYYTYDNSYRDFDCNPDATFEAVNLAPCEEKPFIQRGVPYPDYSRFAPKNVLSRGTVVFGDTLTNPNRDRYVSLPRSDCNGFPLNELDYVNSDEVEKGRYTVTSTALEPAEPTELGANEYLIYHFGRIRTGFISLEVEADEDTELMAVFDELLDENNDVSTRRIRDTIAVVIWRLKAGKYTLVANEPYVLQYLKLINKSGGALRINKVEIIGFIFNCEIPKLNSGNESIDRIFEAAIETFRQNTLDIYMDCASRERAGWLCDSYFTSRVERLLTGKSLVEKNFLENFLMPDGMENLPKEMFPMCYPSDSMSGTYIPNWAMWYVLELEEYLERTNDTALIEKAKAKILSLADFFAKLENEDGLLEHLPSWVFVEWSKANDFTQDVNYPSNMLYARMLRSIGKLYDEKYIAKAEKIEQTIREQSYFDGFFHDHAVRNEEGKLVIPAEDVSETCQYYAFYLGTATKETYPELWTRMLDDFGPYRAETGKWAQIYPSNAFIGNYLRLELLMMQGLTDKVLDELVGYFMVMTEKTGTLWENQRQPGSCSHGFASHVAVWLTEIFNK